MPPCWAEQWRCSEWYSRVTMNFLVEAARRQRAGIPFHGVIYAHQLRVFIGICVSHLEMIAKAGDPSDVINAVLYLPL
jgi:hypothetical protein